jgi:hypothetical protein
MPHSPQHRFTDYQDDLAPARGLIHGVGLAVVFFWLPLLLAAALLWWLA